MPDELIDNTSEIQQPTMQAQETVDNYSYDNQVCKMTPEERIELFNKAFDVNKNQIMLTFSHFFVRDH